MSHIQELGGATKVKAYAYLRLSVDKEDGHAQSIEAQRHALRAFAARENIEIVEEFVDTGMSGRSAKRPAFTRMIEQATSDTRPVRVVLIYRLARLARDLRISFNALGALDDANVETVSVTEQFGQGRSKRLGYTISALIAEQQAVDASIYTRKSRRENARQGFFNGGPVAFGYETYVAQRDGQKERKKLRIVPSEAAVVREIFDWVDAGRGGRWIVRTLNERGTTLRGAKFSNSNLSNIIARETYAGVYHDKTADDDGNAPEREDWIAVPCPAIIERAQFERVAALRATRNPRRTAPHIAAGTTMLSGLVRCGGQGCGCGMTVRSGKSGQYHYYVCNARVNRGRTCDAPSIRREQLDGVVLEAVERRLLAPDRLQALLADVLELSDRKRAQLEDELVYARAEQTRLRTAIERLLILVEEGIMKPRDPEFARRISENRSALAAMAMRVDVLETQLRRGARRITPETVARFGELLSTRLRDEDPTLRTAYLRMLVSEVRVSKDAIVISGPKSALENGVATGVPRLEGTVPIFDREWCRLQDSNL